MFYAKITEDEKGEPMVISMGEAYTDEGNLIDFSGLIDIFLEEEQRVKDDSLDCSDEDSTYDNPFEAFDDEEFPF